MGGMPGMLPGMGMGVGRFHGIYGMFPWVGGMLGMTGVMARMRSGMPAAAKPGVTQSPVGDNVYRPSLDHLTCGSVTHSTGD